MKQKTVAILFTGGLDSTYLMYKNLQEGHIIYPFYVNVNNNKNKAEIEIQQSNLIIEEFRKHYKQEINQLVNICDIDMHFINQNSYALVQAPMWVFAISWLQGHFDEIQIGYVMNDCAISYLNEIKSIYKSFNKLYGREHKKQVPLTFPISKVDKISIFQQMPQYVKHLIFSCEAPINGKCCNHNCDTCKKYQMLQINNNLNLYDYKMLFDKNLIAQQIELTDDIIPKIEPLLTT